MLAVAVAVAVSGPCYWRPTTIAINSLANRNVVDHSEAHSQPDDEPTRYTSSKGPWIKTYTQNVAVKWKAWIWISMEENSVQVELWFLDASCVSLDFWIHRSSVHTS
jgi:hypothetical protein